MAGRIGITPGYVAKWERWQARPTRVRQAQLAEVQGCPVDELLEQADPDLEVMVIRIEAGVKRQGRWPNWKGTKERVET